MVALCGDGLTNKILRLLYVSKVLEECVQHGSEVLGRVEEGVLRDERLIKDLKYCSFKVRDQRSSLLVVCHVACDEGLEDKDELLTKMCGDP